MSMAVDRVPDQAVTRKRRGGSDQDILSDLLDVTSEKEGLRSTQVMSLAKWGEHVTINGCGKHRRKCRFSQRRRE